MKKLFIALVFIMGCTAMQAQWGIKGGFNFANLKGKNTDDLNVLTAWHLGIVYENHITNFFSFQPELLYSVQGAKLKDTEFKLNYFNVPLMLKLYPTDGFNIQVGPQLGMLVSESDNFEGYKSETFDFGLAAGLEFFITDGFFIQARYYAGGQKVSSNTDIKNRVVSASIGYMF